MTEWWSTCKENDRVWIPFLGGHVWWIEGAQLALKLAEARALHTRYGRFMASGHFSPTGSYSCRDIRGIPGTHSEHAHPAALDIRYRWNPMNDDGVMRTDFTRFGLRDGVRFVNSFVRGPSLTDPGLFRWGGNWSTNRKLTKRYLARNGQKVRDGRVDAMHFELEWSPDELRARKDEIRRALWIARHTLPPKWRKVAMRHA